MKDNLHELPPEAQRRLALLRDRYRHADQRNISKRDPGPDAARGDRLRAGPVRGGWTADHWRRRGSFPGRWPSGGRRYIGQIRPLPSASALPFITTADGSTELAEVDRPPTAELEQGRAGAEGRGTGELALVLGNPATGDLDATASLAVERSGLGSLPFAEQEAEAIAALYGVEPLIGEAATEGAVRGRATGAELLHLAAHGHYNPVAPLSSLIALAPDETYDGWLTVGEVYGLDLSQADLVVLSACQTQLGELSAGDELVGLTRAFFFAGTPTVVASLWSVDDEATSVLMERFHTHLSQGMGKAEALRQTQLEVMEAYPNPYHWSAFVISGDGGAVSEAPPQVPASVEAEGVGERKAGETSAPSVEAPASRPSNWLWLVVGAGLLIVVVVGGVLWRRAKRPPTAER